MLHAREQASSDQSELDWEVYHKFNGFAVTTIQLVGTIIVMSQVGWEILLLFAPVFVACIFMQVCEPSSSISLFLFNLEDNRLVSCQQHCQNTWSLSPVMRSHSYIAGLSSRNSFLNEPPS